MIKLCLKAGLESEVCSGKYLPEVFENHFMIFDGWELIQMVVWCQGTRAFPTNYLLHFRGVVQEKPTG